MHLVSGLLHAGQMGVFSSCFGHTGQVAGKLGTNRLCQPVIWRTLLLCLVLLSTGAFVCACLVKLWQLVSASFLLECCLAILRDAVGGIRTSFVCTSVGAVLPASLTVVWQQFYTCLCFSVSVFGSYTAC